MVSNRVDLPAVSCKMQAGIHWRYRFGSSPLPHSNSQSKANHMNYLVSQCILKLCLNYPLVN